MWAHMQLFFIVLGDAPENDLFSVLAMLIKLGALISSLRGTVVGSPESVLTWMDPAS